MVVNEKNVSHRKFGDFIEYLEGSDLLILNDSKVIKARIEGVKDTGGSFELLVERILEDDTALCYVRVNKPLKPGRFVFCARQPIEVLRREGMFYVMRFPMRVLEFLEQHGSVPLPPYLHRNPSTDDEETYQTVYATNPGSAAAPTAGLHFTDELLGEIASIGVNIKRVTLHIGVGTFRPVKSENLADHEMHSERYEIPEDTLEAIQSHAGRVVAVGTTVVRTLESWAQSGKTNGETNLFITPGYRFRVVDALLTNFHLPESTLLMLVAAFSGYDRIMSAYKEAVESGYRFFSYGDAMLLNRYDV